MANDEIGGRPVTITNEDGKIKVVFHPIAKGAKRPWKKIILGKNATNASEPCTLKRDISYLVILS